MGWKFFVGVVPLLALTACVVNSGGGGGRCVLPVEPVQAISGPGDVENVFPLAVGDLWHDSVTHTAGVEKVPKARDYEAVSRVTGTAMVNQVVALVRSYWDTDGSSWDDYFTKDAGGVTLWGSSDVSDFLTAALAPFRIMRFPVDSGDAFVPFDCAAIPISVDLDGDSVPETLGARSKVSVAGRDDVTVTAGYFSDAIRVDESYDLQVRYSADGSSVRVLTDVSGWYAPGVGRVMESARTETAPLGSPPAGADVETEDTELLGATVSGVSGGLQPELDLTPGELDFPGCPTVASDGSRFLVVFLARGPDPVRPPLVATGLYGMFVSAEGVPSDPFPILGPNSVFSLCRAEERLAAAFDGTNFLVAFTLQSRIWGVRISPSGEVLDPGGGFLIADITFPQENVGAALSFGGDAYLVVWHRADSFSGSARGNTIMGAFVSPDGTVGPSMVLADDPDTSRLRAATAFDGTNFLVAWLDGRGAPANLPGPRYIYGARVARDGTVIDPGGFPVALSISAKERTRVAFDGTDFRVSWTDNGFPDENRILTRRIATDGTLVDGPATDDGREVEAGRVIYFGIAGVVQDSVEGHWRWHNLTDYTNVASTDTHALWVWQGPVSGLFGAMVFPKFGAVSG